MIHPIILSAIFLLVLLVGLCIKVPNQLSILFCLMLAISVYWVFTCDNIPAETNNPKSHTDVIAEQRFDAIVDRVIDGDTFIAIHNGSSDKIRMAAIDAPESTQEFGDKSKEWLEQFKGTIVTIEAEGIDRYKRVVGTVYANETNINQLEVREGYAWYCPEYKNGGDYSIDQQKAIKARSGLWKNRKAIPPSLYRSLKPMGDYAESIIKDGFMIDNDGNLHNSRCTVDCQKEQWNGIQQYKNCNMCGGALF